MKKTIRGSLIFLIASMLLSGICITGAAQKETGIKPGKGNLVYDYPADKLVKYVTTSKVVQNIDVNGQSMQNNVNSIMGCTIKSLGMQEKNLKLEITIDTVGQLVESAMGSAGGGIADVEGKKFNMIITPKGKEVDFSGANAISVAVPGSGSSTLGQSFAEFFPDLPEGKVKPGFTWTTNDSSTSRTSTMTTWVLLKSDYQYEGTEKAGKIKYDKITASLSGARKLKTQSQGMDILVYGPFKGTITILFDQKSGYFVKQSATSSLSGTVEITSPESMSFPVIMDISSVTEVKK